MRKDLPKRDGEAVASRFRKHRPSSAPSTRTAPQSTYEADYENFEVKPRPSYDPPRARSNPDKRHPGAAWLPTEYASSYVPKKQPPNIYSWAEPTLTAGPMPNAHQTTYRRSYVPQPDLRPKYSVEPLDYTEEDVLY